MHAITESQLEEYLSGRSNRDLDRHLADCGECREQVGVMRQLSGLMGVLRSDAPPEPALGFEARVMRRVAAREHASLWNVFTIDPAFARKLAFGSLLSLAALGGYLFTGTEDAMAKADHTPEAVIASHNAGSLDQQQHLDGMLLTLATYHQ